MTQSVLAAVDLSHPEDAAAIIAKARDLTPPGARLSVVTVIPDYGMSIVGTYFDKDQHRKALDHANAALHEAVSAVLGPGAEVKHIVAHGTAYEEILDAAKVVSADLIVMGAHKPDYRDYLLGPNAARVVRHATASVHVMRGA